MKFPARNVILAPAFALAAAAVLTVIGCGPEVAPSPPDLGQLEFPTSASPSAHPCLVRPQMRKPLQSVPLRPPPGVDRDAHRLQMVPKIREVLEEHPDNRWVHHRYIKVRTAQGNSRNDVASEYQGFVEAHPDSPMYRYLLGVALSGWKTSEAIASYQKALELAPAYAEAHLELARVYRYPAFRDPDKALEHLKRFLELCPDALRAYPVLGRMDAPEEFRREAAARFREILTRPENEPFVGYWTNLWALEFGTTPPQEHARVREQVSKDVERIKRSKGLDKRSKLHTLEEAYRILGRDEEAETAKKELREESKDVVSAGYDAYKKWIEENPYPKPGVPQQKREAYSRKLLAASEQWVKKWPDHELIRLLRLGALAGLDDVPDERVIEEAEALRQAAAKSSGFPSSWELSVAEVYVERGLRVDQIPELVRQGIERMREHRTSSGDIVDRAEQEKHYREMDDANRWRGWVILTKLQLKTKEHDRAREILMQMEDFLADRLPAKEDESLAKLMRASQTSQLWQQKAQLALAEERKLDALAFFEQALIDRPRWEGQPDSGSEELVVEARTLWDELGGTLEGWQTWRLERATEAALSWKDLGFPTWDKLDEALPEFELTDLKGSKWTLTHFKGKVTFVNIWATWCGPCREELPELEKLHKKLADRQDAQVLTFNVDDNLGLIEPYLKKKGFTFPVIPAQRFLERFRPTRGVPTNWLVDAEAVLRRESRGFSQADGWVDKMIQAIEELGAFGDRKL